MTSAFDWGKYENQPLPTEGFDWSKYEAPEDTRSLGQKALALPKQYGVGYGGGAGGIGGDIVGLLKSGFGGIAGAAIPESAIPKGTHELSDKIAEQFDVDQPLNSLERIFKESGQFAGQEAVLGTALGGPMGGLAGTAHGTASGMLYAGLKEAGVPDNWALGITALSTLSPIAFQKLLPKIQEKMASFKKPTAKAPPPPPTPPTPPSAIEQLLSGKPGETLYETAERAIGEAKAQSPLLEKPSGTSAISLPKSEPIEAIKPERVTKEPGLGEHVSKEHIETGAAGGGQAETYIKEAAKEERKPVEKAYERARKVTEESNDIYPDLATKNDALINQLEKVEKRNAGQETVYQQALTLRKMVGQTDAYIEQNAERLLAQSDSMSQLANYEFPYTGYKGMLKKVVRDTNESVINSLKRQGKNYRAVQIADERYAKWADKFLGDEISPFLEKKILNPEGLFDSLVKNPGNYRAVNNAIGKSHRQYMQAVDRAIVEDRLSKFWKNPETIGTEEFNKSVKDLKALIGNEPVEKAIGAFNKRKAHYERAAKVKEAGKETARKAPPIKERVSSATVDKAAQVTNLTPSQLLKKLDSPEGLREIKKALPKNLYEDITNQKLRSVLREGNIEKEVTSQEIYKFLNKEDTYQLFAEILGKEEAIALRDTAKIAAKQAATQKFTADLIKKLAKEGAITAVKGTIAIKAVKFLFKLIA